MKRNARITSKWIVAASSLPIAVTCLSLGLIVFFLFIGCASTQPSSGTDPFVGTWTNDRSVTRWKYEHRPDGKIFVYWKHTPSQPFAEGRWQIVRTWRDAKGDYLYEVSALWSGLPYDAQSAHRWYITARVYQSGNRLDEIANQSDFVDTTDPNLLWQTYHRQK